MANHHWELGIDWTAVIDPANASYMPGGFILLDAPESPVIKRPRVSSGDTITFRIFDVTRGIRTVSGIQSLIIEQADAVQGQQPENIHPLTFPQPEFTSRGEQTSVYFEGPFPCWTREAVVSEVAAGKRFLLTFNVQALGPDPANPRPFTHDPEMVVGPNM